MRPETKKKIYAGILILTLIALFWYSYREASSEELKDYIGDEVWYVPAARNLLHEMGISVHYENNGSYGVNLIFPEGLDEGEAYALKLRIWRIAEGYNYTEYVPYENFPAVYYEIPAEKYDSFLSNISGLNLTVIPGFRYPDKESIHTYQNLEHPYLGKGIISLGMIVEDEPIAWRIPGIIEHLLIAILVFLAAYEIARSYLAAFIAFFFVVLDPLLFATSITAMLDIHVAFFTALFVYFLVRDDLGGSGLSIGLAAAVKLNGGFPYPVLAIKLWREKGIKKGLYEGFLLPLSAFVLANLPAMYAVGPYWWGRQFVGSFKWHLSFKGEHPANSPFWQWFINEKPFPFHYDPNVFAHTDPVLMLIMLAMVLAIPYTAKKRGKVLIPFGAFWSIIGFYALQWILGGRTQFSFYATPLVPAGAIAVGVFLYEVVKWEYFEESLWMYWGWLKGAFLNVVGLFRGKERLINEENEGEHGDDDIGTG